MNRGLTMSLSDLREHWVNQSSAKGLETCVILHDQQAFLEDVLYAVDLVPSLGWDNVDV